MLRSLCINNSVFIVLGILNIQTTNEALVKFLQAKVQTGFYFNCFLTLIHMFQLADNKKRTPFAVFLRGNLRAQTVLCVVALC